MANLTVRAIQTLEHDPHLFELAMAEVVAHIQREQELADRLDAALRESQHPEESGWIDWATVIEHFRRRATAGYVRDELRRNRRIALSADDVTGPAGESGPEEELPLL